MKPQTSLTLTLLSTSLSIVLAPATFAQTIISAPDGTGSQINLNGNQYNITGGTQAGQNLFHSFEKFGLNPGEIANFLTQPNIQNILGRVVGGDASVINGLIQVLGGNSNLFLMNPAGIIFGPNSQLNVPADFTVTTANAIGLGNNQWFHAIGDNNYSQLMGTPSEFRFDLNQGGSIINLGKLTVSEGSNLTLISGNAINLGTLEAPGGKITIAAIPDQKILRITQEGHLLSLDIPIGDQQQSQITALKLPQLLTHPEIHHANQIQVNAEGQVILSGSGIEIPNRNGVTIASGNLNTSSTTGGEINLLGDRVGVIDAILDGSGTFGGGTLRIGGDFKGNPLFPTANITYINENSLLTTDAQQFGNGGNIFIWSEKQTQFDGTIFSRGGAQGGDGGFTEVSSRQGLNFLGNVDLTAPLGENGQLLLDPKNIFIVSGTSAPDDAALNNKKILAADAPGQDLFISEGKIEKMLKTSSLIFEATNDITIQSLSNGILGGDSFTHSLTFTADADKDGVGSFSMQPQHYIRTQGSITISGENITAGHLHTFSLTRKAGDVTLNAPNNIEVTSINASSDSAQSAGNVIINSTQGNVAIAGETNTSNRDNGDAGSVTIKAPHGDISTNQILTYADQEDGGKISLESGGRITVDGKIDSRSEKSGTSGDISLIAEGDIQVSRSIASGGYGISNTVIGGDILIRSNNGELTVGGQISSGITGSGDAGDITINVHGDITTDEIVSGVFFGQSGQINITSETGKLIIQPGFLQNALVALCGSTLQCNSNQQIIGGSANFTLKPTVGQPIPVNITFTSTNNTNNTTNSSTNNTNSSTNTNTNTNTDTIHQTFEDEDGNKVEITADVPISPEGIPIPDGGIEVEITVTGEWQNPSAISTSVQGTGGDINLSAPGGIFLDSDVLTSVPLQGDAGNLEATSSQAGIEVGNVDTSANIGNGGDISFQGQQAIVTRDLNALSESVGNGGNVILRSFGSSVTTDNVNTSANDGNGGNVNVGAYSNISIQDLDTSSQQGDAGNATFRSQTGTVSINSINVSAPQGNPGEVTIIQNNPLPNYSPPNQGEVANVVVPDLQSQEDILVVEPEVARQEVPLFISESPVVISPTPSGEFLSDQMTELNELDRLAIDLSSLNLQGDGWQQSLEEKVQEIDYLMTEEYSQYVKKESGEMLTTAGIMEVLGKIEQETGLKPGVVYVLSNPTFSNGGLKYEGQIALVLVTPEGNPIVKTVPSRVVNPEISPYEKDVSEVIRELPDRLNSITTDLKKSPDLKHLYQMLIAPLEAEMAARGVDTLLFSMDSGLRSVPLAMLHDGEQFLIEKYSLALIPSVNLTNSTYEGLRDARVLAMGASEFPHANDMRKPLPNVPVELEVITSIREGDRFLNEQFTLENMKAQRHYRKYDIVHLATHASFKSRDQTALEFWDKTIQLDTLREFKWHNDPQVELLILSACETAIGDAEAELGFAGLSVRAGVKSSLATLWRVDDLATVALMATFYEYLATEPIKAEALRQAQLAILRGEVRIENGELVTPRRRVALPSQVVAQVKGLQLTNDLSQPIHWAGFTIVGSPW